MTTIRRFTLRDTMVLVVATALGLALARWPYARLRETSTYLPTAIASPQPPATLQNESLVRAIIGTATQLSTLFYPSVMTFSVAILILSLAQPRPRLRQVFRQPGVAACAAAVLACFVSFLLLTSDTIWARNKSVFSAVGVNYWLSSSRSAGFAVVGAWIVLALGGRWQSGRSWIDHTGRALGICWLAALALEFAIRWSSLLC